MTVARIATFAPGLALHDDDARRAAALGGLLRSLPGFVAGYQLHDAPSGRLMDLSIWESEAALEAAERAVRARPVPDQRGIRPTRVERWTVDAVL